MSRLSSFSIVKECECKCELDKLFTDLICHDNHLSPIVEFLINSNPISDSSDKTWTFYVHDVLLLLINDCQHHLFIYLHLNMKILAQRLSKNYILIIKQNYTTFYSFKLTKVSIFSGWRQQYIKYFLHLKYGDMQTISSSFGRDSLTSIVEIFTIKEYFQGVMFKWNPLQQQERCIQWL